MSKRKRRYYGCCSGLPKGLLQSDFRYPQWYIKYICGEGSKNLPRNVQKVLAYLGDGSWKVAIGKSGVGVGTVEAMVELELIRMSPAVEKSSGVFVAKADGGRISDISDPKEFGEYFKKPQRGFIGTYQITKRGRISLLRNLLP